MSGLLLRLAGPLQSWGERSAFELRDTSGIPTRSGLIGMIACAMGLARGVALDALTPLEFTIRIDRPGVRMVDYHTVGGGLPAGQKIPTADGKGRPAGKGTMQTWREYLADAVFVVAVWGPDELVRDTGDALAAPRWQPYLGRRSCPPSEPFLLARNIDDPVYELENKVPLAREYWGDENTVAVDFVYESGDDDAARSEMRDVPTVFTSVDRAYRTRSVWIMTRAMPSELTASPLRYHANLVKYLGREG